MQVWNINQDFFFFFFQIILKIETAIQIEPCRMSDFLFFDFWLGSCLDTYGVGGVFWSL